ncbi:MAG: hypothetical protein U0787_03170 [Polyangia bacterium]
MRRYLPHVVTLLGLFAGPVAIVHADPIRFSLKTPVPQPDKPQLVVIADQPISDLVGGGFGQELRSALGSASGESGEFKYQAKKLSAGQKMSFGLGSGKPGATHWEGMISAKVGGAPWKQPVTFDTVLTRTIQIGYDKNYVSPHLNVEKRFVELTLSSPAGHAEIEVFSDEGIKMGEGKASFAGEPAGTWLRIPWEGTSAAPNESVVLRLSVKLFDKDGASGQHINLYPWSVSVPHEDVNFETNSWEVRDSEKLKLDESCCRISAVLDRVEKTLLKMGRTRRGAGLAAAATVVDRTHRYRWWRQRQRGLVAQPSQQGDRHVFPSERLPHADLFCRLWGTHAAGSHRRQRRRNPQPPRRLPNDAAAAPDSHRHGLDQAVSGRDSDLGGTVPHL